MIYHHSPHAHSKESWSSMHSSNNSPVVSEYQCELLGVGQLSEEDGYAVPRRGGKGNIEEVRQPN